MDLSDRIIQALRDIYAETMELILEVLMVTCTVSVIILVLLMLP